MTNRLVEILTGLSSHILVVSLLLLFLVKNITENENKESAVDKNIKVCSFESNEKTQRQSMGHITQFRIMNPHQ